MTSAEPRNAYSLRRLFEIGLIIMGFTLWGFGALVISPEERAEVDAPELIVGAVMFLIGVATLWYGRKGYSYFRRK